MSYKLSSSCRKCSLLLGFMLLCLISFSQYDFSSLDKKLKESQKELGKNIVALISKDGKIIYKRETEEFKINSQEPIQTSCQWLTTALVMTFVDQNKLSLDDKVSKWLPVFTKYGKSYITIRNCLTHTTGIQSSQGMKIFEKSKFASLDEEVNDFASKHEIQNNPGIEFRFSNIGADIAARVLEVITKKQFEQLMNERILRPLSMKNTSFFSDRAVNPSGGAISTAQDYMNFLIMILNKGVFKDKMILSEKAIEEMEKVQTNLTQINYASKSVEGFTYALGAWVQSMDDNNNGIELIAPSFTGIWPLIDRVKGYAFILFTKSSSGEQKKNFYVSIKQIIDNTIEPYQ
jgi:CubicO group peptidase (beta-lactamase class C family)